MADKYFDIPNLAAQYVQTPNQQNVLTLFGY